MNAAAQTAEMQSIAALYLPIVAAMLLRLLQGPRPRRFAACLLAALWTATTLLILQALNQHAHWWNFPNAAFPLSGMPLALCLGWIVLWGILPQLAFPRLPLVAQIAAAFAVDLFTMPLLGAIVHLNHNWLIGEAAALAIVLAPALALARWTQRNTHLPLRATLQIALSGTLFLYALPEITFALHPGSGWQPLLTLPGWQLQLALQAIALLALPGISAVAEFVQRGHGTPIPYDPPQRLVTTGLYRYLANPMQLSCTVVMLAWAALLRSPWLLLVPAISLVYSAGIANWDEAKDLAQRFATPWLHYRGAVHNWVPRWRPFHTGPPVKLYVASTCGPCTQLRRWLESKHPTGLQILPAETIPDIHRIRYQNGPETAEGLRALARALEHLHLGWALAGAALRLPLVWQTVQVFTDAAGFGPRHLPYCPTPPPHSTTQSPHSTTQSPCFHHTVTSQNRTDFHAPLGVVTPPRKLQ